MANAYSPGGENPAWGHPVIPPQQPDTIPPQQYVAPTQSLPPSNSGTWTTGICGCFEEIESCEWTHHSLFLLDPSFSLSLSLSLSRFLKLSLEISYHVVVVVVFAHKKDCKIWMAHKLQDVLNCLESKKLQKNQTRTWTQNFHMKLLTRWSGITFLLLFVFGRLLGVLVSMCSVWAHCWNCWWRQHKYAHTHTHLYLSPPSSVAAREWKHE